MTQLEQIAMPIPTKHQVQRTLTTTLIQQLDKVHDLMLAQTEHILGWQLRLTGTTGLSFRYSHSKFL
jgi:hypothetical protein